MMKYPTFIEETSLILTNRIFKMTFISDIETKCLPSHVFYYKRKVLRNANPWNSGLSLTLQCMRAQSEGIHQVRDKNQWQYTIRTVVKHSAIFWSLKFPSSSNIRSQMALKTFVRSFEYDDVSLDSFGIFLRIIDTRLYTLFLYTATLFFSSNLNKISKRLNTKSQLRSYLGRRVLTLVKN